MSKKREIKNIVLYDVYENKLKNNKLNGKVLNIKITTKNAEGEIAFAGAYIKDIQGNSKLITKLATAKVASNGMATLRLDIPFSYLSYSFLTGTKSSTEYFTPKVVVSFVPRLEAWVENNKLYVGYENGKQLSYEINTYGMVELPADNSYATNGQFTFDGIIMYRYYNRNDITQKHNLKDQWGKAEHIANLINAILEYKRSYPYDIIEIGDMRSPINGAVPNSSETHLHHKNEGAIDIRFLGEGGSFVGNINETWVQNKFDNERTQKFMDALGNHSFTRFILSSKLKNRKLRPTGTLGIKWDFSKVHDNHYHVDMSPNVDEKP